MRTSIFKSPSGFLLMGLLAFSCASLKTTHQGQEYDDAYFSTADLEKSRQADIQRKQEEQARIATSSENETPDYVGSGTSRGQNCFNNNNGSDNQPTVINNYYGNGWSPTWGLANPRTAISFGFGYPVTQIRWGYSYPGWGFSPWSTGFSNSFWGCNDPFWGPGFSGGFYDPWGFNGWYGNNWFGYSPWGWGSGWGWNSGWGWGYNPWGRGWWDRGFYGYGYYGYNNWAWGNYYNPVFVNGNQPGTRITTPRTNTALSSNGGGNGGVMGQGGPRGGRSENPPTGGRNTDPNAGGRQANPGQNNPIWRDNQANNQPPVVPPSNNEGQSGWQSQNQNNGRNSLWRQNQNQSQPQNSSPFRSNDGGSFFGGSGSGSSGGSGRMGGGNGSGGRATGGPSGGRRR